MLFQVLEKGYKLGISGHSYRLELEPRSLIPYWPFIEQLLSKRQARN